MIGVNRRRYMGGGGDIDYSKQYLTFEALEDGTFQFVKAIQYSLDNGNTWTSLTANTASPTVTAGNKIMWKGTLTPTSSNGVGAFSATGNFAVQGNAMSLLYGDNFKGQTDLTGKDYAFYRLFTGNRKVINAKDLSLPATTLVSHCYRSMFQSCTGLVTAPVLPATTLKTYCYTSMFQGCTGLVNAPELPATTLAQGCYQYMFQSCTGLVNAPELPATTLAGGYCYVQMFRGCTNLVTVQSVLPATILTSSCYNSMFQGCTSLVTAPVLPATTLASNCYQHMFQSCTNLNYIKAMFTTTPDYIYTSDWVEGVSSTGTFVKNSAATWEVTGVNGVPSGWTIETASE